MSGWKAVRRVLLSVTDKSGIVDFARVLHGLGAELISTGGTARTLREAGLPVPRSRHMGDTITAEN